MATRTTGAIALRPTGNAQGGYYLYSLSTGRVLSRNHWTPLPMLKEVIDRLHVLGRRSTAALTFTERDGVIIPNNDDGDDPDDPDFDPDHNHESNDDNAYASDDSSTDDDNDAPDAYA